LAAPHRSRGLAIGGEAGYFQGRRLEEPEAQLAADAVALLAPGAVTCCGGDGGVESAFASLAKEHLDILWSVARLVRMVEPA
jgi:hypothetical protein